jgi:hypothetical protein
MMKAKINVAVHASYGFILLLILSGMFDGILSEVLYYLAFLLPICLSIYNIREENPDKSRLDFGIKLNTDGIITALPLFLPIISVTALISFATSEFIMELTESNALNCELDDFGMRIP